MAVIVSLRDVVEEMDLTSDEATAYINRKTGELITLTHEELALAEDPEGAEDAPVSYAPMRLLSSRVSTKVQSLYPNGNTNDKESDRIISLIA